MMIVKQPVCFIAPLILIAYTTTSVIGSSNNQSEVELGMTSFAPSISTSIVTSSSLGIAEETTGQSKMSDRQTDTSMQTNQINTSSQTNIDYPSTAVTSSQLKSTTISPEALTTETSSQVGSMTISPETPTTETSSQVGSMTISPETPTTEISSQVGSTTISPETPTTATRQIVTQSISPETSSQMETTTSTAYLLDSSVEPTTTATQQTVTRSIPENLTTNLLTSTTSSEFQKMLLQSSSETNTIIATTSTMKDLSQSINTNQVSPTESTSEALPNTPEPTITSEVEANHITSTQSSFHVSNIMGYSSPGNEVKTSSTSIPPSFITSLADQQTTTMFIVSPSSTISFVDHHRSKTSAKPIASLSNNHLVEHQSSITPTDSLVGRHTTITPTDSLVGRHTTITPTNSLVGRHTTITPTDSLVGQHTTNTPTDSLVGRHTTNTPLLAEQKSSTTAMISSSRTNSLVGQHTTTSSLSDMNILEEHQSRTSFVIPELSYSSVNPLVGRQIITIMASSNTELVVGSTTEVATTAPTSQHVTTTTASINPTTDTQTCKLSVQDICDAVYLDALRFFSAERLADLKTNCNCATHGSTCEELDKGAPYEFQRICPRMKTSIGETYIYQMICFNCYDEPTLCELITKYNARAAESTIIPTSKTTDLASVTTYPNSTSGVCKVSLQSVCDAAYFDVKRFSNPELLDLNNTCKCSFAPTLCEELDKGGPYDFAKICDIAQATIVDYNVYHMVCFDCKDEPSLCEALAVCGLKSGETTTTVSGLLTDTVTKPTQPSIHTNSSNCKVTLPEVCDAVTKDVDRYNNPQLLNFDHHCHCQHTPSLCQALDNGPPYDLFSICNMVQEKLVELVVYRLICESCNEEPNLCQVLTKCDEKSTDGEDLKGEELSLNNTDCPTNLSLDAICEAMTEDANTHVYPSLDLSERCNCENAEALCEILDQPQSAEHDFKGICTAASSTLLAHRGDINPHCDFCVDEPLFCKLVTDFNSNNPCRKVTTPTSLTTTSHPTDENSTTRLTPSSTPTSIEASILTSNSTQLQSSSVALKSLGFMQIVIAMTTSIFLIICGTEQFY